MDEVIVRRGEIYWIRQTGVGSEQSTRRPGVIVSSQKGNETSPLVNICYVTSKNKYGKINVPIKSAAVPSCVECNQLFVVDKMRLIGKIGELTEREMAEVNQGICIALGLNPDDSESSDEKIRELKEEIASLKSAKDGTALKVERDMWKKMYEKALEMLVEKKMEKDTAPTVNTATEAEVEEVVEINTATEAELRNIGCNANVIHNIIANRPYKSVENLKVIPGMTRIAYQLIEKRVCCIPPMKANVAEEPKVSKVSTEVSTVSKVNVNTATVEEMMTGGLPKSLSERIRAYRNKGVVFGCLEDLLQIDVFGKGCLKKYGDRLTV